MTRRLVVYAHYDADGEAKRYVLHGLRALREVATRLVFVTTAALSPDEIQLVEPHCDEVRARENVGYDFAMWRDVLAAVVPEAWDEVVLTNSSVYGPLFPLAPIFAAMAHADAWGMTESREIAWHLQSYFLVARRRTLDAPAWRAFWERAVPLASKRDVIRRYEVGLSQALRDASLSLAAFAPESALPASRTPANPTIVHPAALLERGMPFVKVELLRDNPRAVPLGPLRLAMERSGYDLSLVER